jgi:hypothetical protein
MIRIFNDYDLVNATNNIPIESGSETLQISGAYTLSFSVRPHIINDYFLNPAVVYGFGGNFYRQLVFSSSDNENYVRNVSATDLFSVVATETLVKNYTNNADVAAHLLALTSMLPNQYNFQINFQFGGIESAFELSVENQSVLEIINKLCKDYNLEYTKNGLQIVFDTRFLNNPVVNFKKGVTIKDYSLNVDTSDVVTYLNYTVDGENPQTISSAIGINYPNKFAYADFKSEDIADNPTLPVDWLSAHGQPKITVNFTAPFSAPLVPLAQGVNIIGVNADFSLQKLQELAPNTFPLRVVSRSRSIAENGDISYVVSSQPPDFAETVAAGSNSGGSGGSSDGESTENINNNFDLSSSLFLVGDKAKTLIYNYSTAEIPQTDDWLFVFDNDPGSDFVAQNYRIHSYVNNISAPDYQGLALGSSLSFNIFLTTNLSIGGAAHVALTDYTLQIRMRAVSFVPSTCQINIQTQYKTNIMSDWANFTTINSYGAFGLAFLADNIYFPSAFGTDSNEIDPYGSFSCRAVINSSYNFGLYAVTTSSSGVLSKIIIPIYDSGYIRVKFGSQDEFDAAVKLRQRYTADKFNVIESLE